jgi:hypothetical protein
LRVDQGTADQFLDTQLKPELLRAACQRAGVALELRTCARAYDHSYFFIASFIEDHLRFHARHLGDARRLNPSRDSRICRDKMGPAPARAKRRARHCRLTGQQ